MFFKLIWISYIKKLSCEVYIYVIRGINTFVKTAGAVVSGSGCCNDNYFKLSGVSIIDQWCKDNYIFNNNIV